MRFPRRHFLRLAARAAALPAAARFAWAQAYPARPKEFRNRIRIDLERWAKLMRAANIEAE
jgi:hypothetical protein